MNEDEFDDVELVVEMQEMHVFNTKACSTYPSTPIVQLTHSQAP
jgi:hypothetical protein